VAAGSAVKLRASAAAAAVLACTAALTAACATTTPSATTTPRATSTPRTAATPAAKYLAVADPANRPLDHDHDGAEDHSHDDLAAATADLRAAAATKRRFDRQLIAITFPALTERFVRLLYAVNSSRAALTATAAGATSLAQLQEFDRRLDQANEPVEEAVQVIRGQLRLPPPDTS
jgi:Flp pilus assembly protein TadB